MIYMFLSNNPSSGDINLEFALFFSVGSVFILNLAESINRK